MTDRERIERLESLVNALVLIQSGCKAGPLNLTELDYPYICLGSHCETSAGRCINCGVMRGEEVGGDE